MSEIFERCNAIVEQSSNFEMQGRVSDVRGMIVEGHGPNVPIGANVAISSGENKFFAQAVGFNRDKVLYMPFNEIHGISSGAEITYQGI